MTIRVDELLDEPEHGVRFTVVQALAKGDRAELAVEMLTEVGVDRIIPWQASRSVVKWAPERRDRQVGRWRTAARKATKQSRRLSVPVIPMPMTTSEVAQVVADAPAALILHESAERMLRADDLAVAGDILVVVGPEGGLSDDEVATFAEAGGRVVLVSDGVLRTSTAGVVAVAAAQALLADADGRA